MIKTNGNETVTQRVGTVTLDKEVMAPAVIEQQKQENSLELVKDRYKQEILASGEVDKLTSLINLSNTTSILEFGKEPATQMAKAADQVLSKYDMTCIQETSILVDSLLQVMKKIDIGEIEDAKNLLIKQAKKSFLDSLISRVKPPPKNKVLVK